MSGRQGGHNTLWTMETEATTTTGDISGIYRWRRRHLQSARRLELGKNAVYRKVPAEDTFRFSLICFALAHAIYHTRAPKRYLMIFVVEHWSCERDPEDVEKVFGSSWRCFSYMMLSLRFPGIVDVSFMLEIMTWWRFGFIWG